MKNLLFLGNSHNAFLHDALKYYPNKDFTVEILSEVKHDYEIGVTTSLLIDGEYKVTFISKIGNKLPPYISVLDGHICTEYQNIKELFLQLNMETIPLNKYDVVVIYGFGLMSIDFGKEWKKLLEERHSNQFSSSCLEQSYMDDIVNSQHYKLLKRIELDEQVNTKIISIPTPLVSEGSDTLKETHFDLPNFIVDLEKIYKQEIEKIRNVSFLSIPHELYAKNRYSISNSFSNDTLHLAQQGSIILFNKIFFVIKEYFLSSVDKNL